jgi:hypothetical protein
MKRTISYALVFVMMLLTAYDGEAAKKKRSRKPPKETLVSKTTAAIHADSREEGKKQVGSEQPGKPSAEKKPIKIGPPVERRLKKAKGGKNLNLRNLPDTRPRQKEKPEREGPDPNPTMADGTEPARSIASDAIRVQPSVEAAAPAPIITFEGLDRFNWGAGSPPDTTGDVGPDYYIQAVNTSVGIYRKSDGFQEAAFTFDTLMSQGSFGNLCDTDNFGDPVVLYDTFEDRWVLTDFAFILDGGGNVNPPIAYQCFAVSMNGDPLTGGWNFYSIELTDGLHDYEKLAVWPDGIYMSANMFGFPAGSGFFTARTWAINKAQMYAGAATVDMVTFDIGAGDFTAVPSNARLQTGTPPPGTPNYFLSTWNFLNAVSVYKFSVNWDSLGLSTLTGPDVPIAATSWPNANVANVPQSGTAQLLDTLQIRAMVQNQYTNFGGVESLWIPHTVRRGNTTGFAAPRWYQVDVSGGTVNANLPQAATWDPDAANVMHRWMPSLAVDRAGNLAMLYSTSSSTTFPSIKYAGRLSSDPINTFGQTEQTMLTGTASQTSSARWGDYSSVMLDPDGCTFWMTTQYANPVSQTFDTRWLTRIGAFKYAECTPVGAGGTLSGTVTATVGGAPIVGAAVELGARSTTTDGSGNYSFANLPAGTYPSLTVSHPGYVSEEVTAIVITDGGTTDQDFDLDLSATNACLLDTTAADFQAGVGDDVDMTTSPGDVILAKPLVIDQQNQTLIGSGFSFTTAWHGQTFTAGVTGPVVRVDLNLFSLDCSLTAMPNITLSIRSATGNVPSGADLGTATITGFCDGGGGFFTANFGTPVNITSGTQYSLVWRSTLTNPSTAGNPRYVSTVSSADPYLGGRRATSTTAGATWTGAAGTANNDFGFIIYVDAGYTADGTLVSSLKDANPLAGLTPTWSTITWNGTAPTDTTLTLQVAASNSPAGPFNFVGPDGTGSTFFSSGASLSQFYNNRYLKYKAALATTNGTVTPTLNDVQVCYQDSDCSNTVATITPTPAAVCSGSAGNTATGPAGASSYLWTIDNGSIQGSTTSQAVSYTAGASGDVELTLFIIMPDGCQDTESLDVPINALPATPTITPGGPTTFCAGGSVTLTSSSATGNQWFLNGNPIGGETNQSYIASLAGSYTVVVTENGCPSAASDPTVVTVTPLPPTPTITPDGPTTFCTGGSVLLTSSSASGNQWNLNGNPIGGETNQTLLVSASGNYTVTVTVSGCSSTSDATTVTVNAIPPTPVINSAPPSICAGGSILLTSTAAAGNQWFRNGVLLPGETNQTYLATIAGAYSVLVTTNGCTNGAHSIARNVVVHPLPDATITVAPTMFSNASGTASVNNASCAGATFAWSITGGTITSGAGTPYITFTAGGAGTLTLQVTVTSAAGCVDTESANVTVSTASFGAPPFLQATATSTSNASLMWANVALAANYEVYRSPDNVNWTLQGTTAGLTFAQGGLTASTTYFYKVRAIKADLTPSAYSPIDPATTFVFTDASLSACGTGIKLVHINELRSTVQMARASIGLGAFAFTDPTLLTTTKIKAVHINELRTAIAPVLTAIGVTPTYADPTITAGTTTVKSTHVRDLRNTIK